MTAISYTDATLGFIKVIQTITVPAGAAIDRGELVTFDATTGKAILALADDIATSVPVGMAMRSVVAGMSLTVLLEGWVYMDGFSGLAFNDPLYVSETTAGVIEDAAPATTGEQIVRVGYIVPQWGGNGGGDFTAQTATHVLYLKPEWVLEVPA